MIVCRNCGTECMDSETFCFNCNTRLIKDSDKKYDYSSAKENIENVVRGNQGAGTWQKAERKFMKGVTVVQIIFVIICAAYFLTNEDFKKETSAGMDERASLGVSEVIFDYYGAQPIGELLNTYCTEGHKWTDNSDNRSPIQKIWNLLGYGTREMHFPASVSYVGKYLDGGVEKEVKVIFVVTIDSVEVVAAKIGDTMYGNYEELSMEDFLWLIYNQSFYTNY